MIVSPYSAGVLAACASAVVHRPLFLAKNACPMRCPPSTSPPGRKITTSMNRIPSVRCQPLPMNGMHDGDHEVFQIPSGMKANQLVQDVVVDLRKDVFEVLDETCAQDRTDQGSGAAEDRHQHDFTTGRPLHAFGPCQGVGRGQKASGQTGVHARDHEGSQRIGARVQARIVHPVLVRLDRPQHHPEGRAEQTDRKVEGQDHHECTEVIGDVLNWNSHASERQFRWSSPWKGRRGAGSPAMRRGGTSASHWQ